jgi:hypothetical protein
MLELFQLKTNNNAVRQLNNAEITTIFAINNINCISEKLVIITFTQAKHIRYYE